jgi:hypothetical protein
MRKLLGLAAVTAAACLLVGDRAGSQTTPTTARRLTVVDRLPATCQPGDIVFENYSAQSYVCTASNTWTVSTLAFPLLAPNGSASAPSYAFSSASNTGIYRSGTGEIVFDVLGSNLAAVGSNYLNMLTPLNTYSRTYSQLSGLSGAVNGAIVYCSDCLPTNPCTTGTGAGGAFAMYVNSAWNCGAVGVPGTELRNTASFVDDFFGPIGKFYSFGSLTSYAIPNRPGVVGATCAAGTTCYYTASGGSSVGASFTKKGGIFFDAIIAFTRQTSTKARIGLFYPGSDPPSDGVYFQYIDGTADWYAVARTGGAETTQDTGVAIADVTYYRFRIYVSGSNAYFSINSGTEYTLSTNVPADAVSLTAGVQYVNGGASGSPVFYFDYVGLRLTGITR